MNINRHLTIAGLAATLIACGGGGGGSSSGGDDQQAAAQKIECIAPRNEAVDGFDAYGLARKGELLWNYSDANNPKAVMAVDTKKQLKQSAHTGNDPIQDVDVFDFAGFTYLQVSAFTGSRFVDHLYVYDGANNQGYPVQTQSSRSLRNIDMRRFPIVMNDKFYATSIDGDELYRIEGCEAKTVGELKGDFTNTATNVEGNNLYILQTSGGIDGQYQVAHYSESEGLSYIDLTTQAKGVSLEMDSDILTVSDYQGGQVDIYQVEDKQLTLMNSFTASLTAEVDQFEDVSTIYHMDDGKAVLKMDVEWNSSVTTQSYNAYVTIDKTNNALTYSRDLPVAYADENLYLKDRYLGGMDFLRNVTTEGGKAYVYIHAGGVFEFAEIKANSNTDLLTTAVKDLVEDNSYVEAVTVNDQYIVIADIVFDRISASNSDTTVKRTEFKKYDYKTKTVSDLVTVPANFNDRTMGSVSYSGFFVTENEFYFELLDGDNDQITTDNNPNRFIINVDTGEFEQLNH